MRKPLVSIITPTFQRDEATLRRCILSVKAQDYHNIEHIIVSDQLEDEVVPKLLAWEYGVRYHHVEEKTGNTWGASARNYGFTKSSGEYLGFLDDDNIVFPDYVSRLVEEMERPEHWEFDFALCEIIHLGPLRENLGFPPVVLDGGKPVIGKVDTLQFFARRRLFYSEVWETRTSPEGYANDGFTIQRLAENHKHLSVNKILGVHF